MNATCDHCGRTYYNASGCECILVGAAPVNTTTDEVNAMRRALNDPGSRPNDPSPPPYCDNCGAPMPPGAREDPASGILLCPDGCGGPVPGDPDPVLLANANRALHGMIMAAGTLCRRRDNEAPLDAVTRVVDERDVLRASVRDLAIALLMDPDASPAEVLRQTRLVMAERMEMQAAEIRRG